MSEHIPYGADMLIDISREAELGILACVNGVESSTVDDPDGSGAIDDEPHISMPGLEEDLSLLR